MPPSQIEPSPGDLLARAFVHAGAAEAVLDSNGCHLEVNEAYEALTGYARATLIGRPLTSLIAEHFRNLVVAKVADYAQGRGVDDEPSEARLVRADGRERTVYLYGRPFAGRDGTFYCALTVLDVTPFKEALSRLTGAVDALEGGFEHAAAALAIVRQRRVARVNRRFAEMLGYPADELVGRDLAALAASPEAAGTLGPMAVAVLAVGRPFDSEVELRRKDGATIRARVAARASREAGGGENAVWAIEDLTAGQRSRESLRQALAGSDVLFDHVGVPVLHARGDTIVRCNRRLAELAGVPAERLRGAPVAFLLAQPESLAEATARSAAGAPARAPVLEAKLRRQDGSALPLRLVGHAADPDRPEEGRLWIGEERAAEPSAKERGAQEQLARALLEQQAIFDNAMIGIAFVRDRVIERCNKRLEVIFGWGPGELEGQSARAWYLSDEEYEELGRLAYEEIEQAGAHTREQVMVRKDGSRFWCRVSGRALDPSDPQGGSVWLLEDVSDRKRAEEQTVRALTEQKLIFDHATVGIAFVRDRLIHRCNRRFEELYGYGPGELVGRSTRVIFADDASFEAMGRAANAAVARGATYVDEHEHVRKDGAPLWLRVTGRAVDPEHPEQGVIWSVDDLTARREAERRLIETTTLQQAILESAGYAIVATDPHGIVRTFNAAAERMLGYAAAELVGQRTLLLFHDPEEIASRARALSGELGGPVEPGLQALTARAAAGGSDEAEWTWIRRDGTCFPALVSVSALRDPQGTVTGFLAVGSDITERKRAEAVLAQAQLDLDQRLQTRTHQLAVTHSLLEAEVAERKEIEAKVQFMATHDGLTGLPNRTLVQDRIEQALALARRRESHVVILCIDLDRFKNINDSLGHVMGDQLLRHVAARIVEAVRPGDTVARSGGDEFMVLLPDVSDRYFARATAERLLSTLSRPFVIDGHELHVTPSIGIAVSPTDGTDADSLIRNADTAMYQAKAHGRNNFQFFTEQMNVVAAEFFRLETDLRHAVEANELRLFYQPVLHARTGEFTALEALVRWEHPARGLLGPDTFIGIAEESGLIQPIGAWVLGEACRQTRSWRQQGLLVPPVSVNLSARQFRQTNLAQQVHTALAQTALPAEALELEITETTLMRDSEQTLATLEQLNRTGISVAVDDFGIGYSSLSYLKRFPVDKLKIDRSFVEELHRNTDDIAIVKAILALARSLGLRVVAEGVENEEQLALLRSFGCNEIQGFYIAPPMPAAEMFGLLTKPQPRGFARLLGLRK